MVAMNLSFWHLLLVLLILIFAFGPSRLEGIGTSLGKAIRGFKKGMNEGEGESKGEEDKTKKS